MDLERAPPTLSHETILCLEIAGGRKTIFWVGNFMPKYSHEVVSKFLSDNLTPGSDIGQLTILSSCP